MWMEFRESTGFDIQIV